MSELPKFNPNKTNAQIFEQFERITQRIADRAVKLAGSAVDEFPANDASRWRENFPFLGLERRMCKSEDDDASALLSNVKLRHKDTEGRRLGITHDYTRVVEQPDGRESIRMSFVEAFDRGADEDHRVSIEKDQFGIQIVHTIAATGWEGMHTSHSFGRYDELHDFGQTEQEGAIKALKNIIRTQKQIIGVVREKYSSEEQQRDLNKLGGSHGKEF